VPNSFTRIDGRSANRSRTTEPRGFVDFGGASTSTRPPCDVWITMRLPSSNVMRVYLP
jgi:hypothetical protein